MFGDYLLAQVARMFKPWQSPLALSVATLLVACTGPTLLIKEGPPSSPDFAGRSSIRGHQTAIVPIPIGFDHPSNLTAVCAPEGTSVTFTDNSVVTAHGVAGRPELCSLEKNGVMYSNFLGVLPMYFEPSLGEQSENKVRPVVECKVTDGSYEETSSGTPVAETITCLGKTSLKIGGEEIKVLAVSRDAKSEMDVREGKAILYFPVVGSRVYLISIKSVVSQNYQNWSTSLPLKVNIPAEDIPRL